MQWSKDNDADPHGVQKLLSLLRAQQDGAGGQQTDEREKEQEAVSSKGSTSDSSLTSGDQTTSGGTVPAWQLELQKLRQSGAMPTQSSERDLRYVSFAQALPHLTQLSKDEHFLRQLMRLKTDQDQFESQLADERKTILGKSKTTNNPAEESEIARWDRLALARWDGLYARQQEKLQMLGVPCFYATRDPGQIRKQQQVFDVLSALLE